MSTTVDERVVEMRFDNKQFENNVQTTMSTLDKLKQRLNLTGATKGLENIGSAAKKVNMTGLTGAIETVHSKFSALEVMGVTTLANFTNSAVNAGKKIVAAFTIDPIKTGFSEYETQINAVQTILANTSSKGTTLEDVNKALDTLNTYADKTIYNFTEMTRNIGTFTAAGVDLDTSVSAIQGIANLAAVSGSTSQQASTAMYQLSQALATGTVKLQDWNSVVNAGMGGEVFQNALKRTATVMGTNVDAMIKKYGSFRDSLTEGEWLTTEVLTETLEQFTMAAEEGSAEWEAFKKSLKEKGYTEEQANEILKMANTATDAATKVKTFTQLMDTLKEAAQSGWTQSWEIIIGDFEEAKALFTEVSDVFSEMINKSAESRNKLLEGVMSSKWEQLEEKINAAGITTEKFQSTLSVVMKEHGMSLEGVIKRYGSLGNAISSGAVGSDKIIETLKRLAGIEDGAASSTENMSNKLEYFQKVVNDVWQGDYKNGEERIKALTEAGYDYATVQNLVNKTVDGHKLTLEDLSDAQLKNVGYTDKEIKKIRELAEQAEKTGTPINKLIEDLNKPSGRELLIDTFRNGLKGLIKSMGAVKEAWSETFDPVTSDQLYNVIEGLNNFSKHLILSDENTDKLKRTFKGLFAILDIISTLTGGTLKTGIKVICKLLGMADVDVLSVTASVGDAIVAFRDWLFENNRLAKGIKKLVNGAETGITVIKNWIDEFVELPIVQKNITQLKKAFEGTFEDLGNYFDGGITRINEFIDRVKNMDSITLDDIDDIFKDFKDNVIDYFLDIDGRFDDIKNAVKDFKEDVKNHFKEAGENVDGFKKKVIDFAESVKSKFSSIGLGEILTVGFGAGLILFVKKLSDVLETIAGPIADFTGFLDGLGKSLNKLAKAKAFSMRADGFIKIATAIAILAGSVALLTYLDQDKLWSAVGALGVLASGLVAVSIALGKLNKVGKVDSSSLSIIAIASSMLILVTAMKQMDDLDSDKILRNMGILATLAVGLGAVAAALGKMAPQLSKGSFFLISFAVSLKILVGALEDLDKINTNNIGNKAPVLIGIIGGLALVAAACKKVKMGGAVTVLAIVVALKILIGAFEDIAKLDTNMMKSNIEAFIGIFGTFAVLMVSSKFAGKNATKAGVSILAMSVALTIIIQAIKMMAKIKPLDLERGLDTISQLLLVFAAVTALSSFAGKNATKAGVMLLLMSGAIAILAGVMFVLSKLDPSGLDRALKAIVTLELVFGALIAITAIAQDCKSTLVTLSVTIGILAMALGALSMINPENLTVATRSLSMVITTFSLLVASTSLAKKASGTLIILTGVIAILGSVLSCLAILPTESTLVVAESLSVLLLALSASLLIISKASTVTPTAIIALAAMSGIVAVLGVILGVLANFNVGPTLEIAESLSILLLSLSASCLILSAVGLIGGGATALAGVAAFAAVVAGVGTLMGAIGALVTYIPNVKEWLNAGLPILEQIGEGLGSFFGGVVGGFIDGASQGLISMGTNLSEFMDEVQPFFDGVKDINSDSLVGVANLAEAILMLTAADVLNSITSIFTGGVSFEEFGKQICKFGEAMVEYSSIVSGGVYPEAVEASANAGLALANLANNLPNSGGVLGYWLGENDINDFGDKIVSFGYAIAAYSAVVKGKIDKTSVEDSANAGLALANLANNLPNSGGALGYWLGENDIDDFGDKIVSFGYAIAAYSAVVKGKIKKDVVEDSANAGLALANLAKAIPNTGGLWGMLCGNNDMSTFGDNLVSFGTDFATYATTVKDIKPSIVTNTANAADSLVKLATSLPDNKLFKDETTLSEFGKTVSTFGEKFNEYYGYISNIDVAKLSGVTTGTSDLVMLAKSMNEVDTSGMKSFGEALKKLGNIGVDGFVEAFDNSSTRVKTAGTTMVTTFNSGATSKETTMIGAFTGMVAKALTSINKKDTDFNDAGQNLMNSFVSGIKTENPNVQNTTTNVVGVVLTSMKGKDSEFSTTGATQMVNYISGIKTKGSTVNGASTSIVSGALTSMSDKNSSFNTTGMNHMAEYASGILSKNTDANKTSVKIVSDSLTSMASKNSSFNTIGTNAIQGFINGMKNKISESVSTAVGIAKAVTNATKKEFGIHSPSKVFKKEVGEMLGKGMAEGIKSSSGEVTSESKKMSDKALEAAQSNYDEFKSWLDDRKFYNKLTIEEEIYALEQAQKKYKNYADIRKEIDKELYTLKQEKEEQALEDKKYYGKLTLKQELAAYKKLLSKYKKGTDKYKELAKKVYSLEQELMEETYQKSLDWIEDKKYYGKLSLVDELAAYKRMQTRYKKGTDERKAIDKEIYNLEKEIAEATEDYYQDVLEVQKEAAEQRKELEEEYNADVLEIEEETAQKKQDLQDEYYEKTTEINDKLLDDIRELNDAYDDALKSRTDSLYKSYSLFDNVEPGEAVEGSTLISNLQSQVDAFEDWQKDINGLAERGIDETLLDELRDMGPSSAAEIKALNSMTDDELNQYVSLWQEKSNLAKEQATYELEDLRLETEAAIATLRTNAENELLELGATFNTNMAQIDTDAAVKLAELKTTFETNLTAINSETETKLAELKTTWLQNLGILSTSTESEFTKMITNVMEIAGDKTKWTTTGANMIEGLLQGVQNESTKLYGAVASVMSSALSVAQNVLGIHSPSKEFAKLGKYSDEGFVNGLKTYANKVSDTAEDVGGGALDAMTSVIAGVSDIINNGVDTEPTIRPVLDLSNVESGTRRLNTLFSRNQAMSISTSMNERANQEIQNGANPPKAGNTYQFTQNNYSPKALSRVEIYRQTKNQFSAMERMVES